MINPRASLAYIASFLFLGGGGRWCVEACDLTRANIGSARLFGLRRSFSIRVLLGCWVRCSCRSVRARALNPRASLAVLLRSIRAHVRALVCRHPSILVTCRVERGCKPLGRGGGLASISVGDMVAVRAVPVEQKGVKLFAFPDYHNIISCD